MQHQERIHKADGVTAAEKYLARLCERSFLSLWSYPGMYRDQGKPLNGGHGKEICDLLVVFDENIIIFSDKDCRLRDSGNNHRDWQRWFKKAIQESAEQAWGAERWIRQNPSRVFIDRECMQALPIDLPSMQRAKFHLVIVAHGVSSRIRKCFPFSSGSLMINTELKGFKSHAPPFCVGDLAPDKTFIHVLDDDSLSTLMTERDTISDFVAYLSKREKLLRGRICVRATGEEQLLAIYLRNLDQNDQHEFVFPIPPGDTYDVICVPEGHWEQFQLEPQRIAQVQHNQVSYAWDELIENFNRCALRGEQYDAPPGGIKDTEKVLRFMAREPRWKRRYFAQAFLDMVKTTPANLRRLRVLRPTAIGEPYYVFLLLPIHEWMTNEQYRSVRSQFLSDCCWVVKLENPDATDIVGIATESGMTNNGRSQDAVFFDARHWTKEMEDSARLFQAKFRILQSAKLHKGEMFEYPEVVADGVKTKNPRNKACPCGSGKKYKHCCLDK
jgi:hypothetical protein